MTCELPEDDTITLKHVGILQEYTFVSIPFVFVLIYKWKFKQSARID